MPPSSCKLFSRNPVAVALRCLLLLAALVGGGTSVRAQTLSASLALLAGLAVPQHSEGFPAVLELPDNWLPVLQKLEQASATGTREVASCVTLTPGRGGSAELQAALGDQAGEVHRPGVRRDGEGQRVAAQVRAQLARPGSALSLSPAALQGGAEASVHASCMGNVVGMFHTHPVALHSLEALSDRDAWDAATQGLAFSGVVYGGNTCVQLKGRGQSLTLESSNIGYFLDMAYGVWQVQGRPAGIKAGLARYADDNGGALYCGPVGKSLSRVPPPTYDWSAPGAREVAVLAAKAWVMALRMREHPEWPAISFALTPEFDSAFQSYLAGIKPASAGALKGLSGLQGPALFRAVVAALPAREPVAWTSGFVLPDARFEQQRPPFYRFGCFEQACLVTKTDQPVAARMTPADPQALYWLNAGFMTSDTPGKPALADSAQRQALRAKAWVLALKWREHPEWPAVDFPFSPELDDAFWHYLQRILPAGSGLLGLMAQKDHPDRVWTTLTQLLPSQAQITWSNGLDVPDSGEPAPAVYQLQCDSEGCLLGELIKHDFYNRIPAAARASCHFGESYYLVDTVQGRQRLVTLDAKGNAYHGDASWNGKMWTESGEGVADYADYRYVGPFVDGAPTGEGLIYERKEQAWHRVHSSHGRMRVEPDTSPAPPDADTR